MTHYISSTRLSLERMTEILDTKEKIASMQCLPDSLVGKEYFTPGNQGLEAKYKARLEEIKKWKEAHSKKQK